jgi:hypothetical protein
MYIKWELHPRAVVYKVIIYRFIQSICVNVMEKEEITTSGYCQFVTLTPAKKMWQFRYVH